MNRRSVSLVSSALALALITAPTLGRWSPRLLWNTTPSVPVGLYWLQPVDRVAIGDLVAVRPPEALVRFLAARGYLADGVPLLKHVVAHAPTQVCRDGAAIRVAGLLLGTAQAQDRHGRDLPRWQGCHRLPTATTPGILDELNRLAFPYRWATRAILMDKLQATRMVARIRRQWFAKAAMDPDDGMDL